MQTPAFKKLIWDFYKKNARTHLPWRNLPVGRNAKHIAYQILVSEVMLQQTQVDRVIPYYTTWMKQFPTAQALARADLASVLTAWQGLGFNTRAKRLQTVAQHIVQNYQGIVPHDAAILESLPGIGPYTANAIMAFAFNHDAVFIETNIRTVILHHFFSKRVNVSDDEILAVLKKVLPRGKARMWYSALMDYGAYLKHSGVNLNKKSKSYSKQSVFKGSGREAGAAIVKRLLTGSATKLQIRLLLKDRSKQLEDQLERLLKEGLVVKRGLYYHVAT